MWDKQKEAFLPSTPGLGMHVEVKDPDGKVSAPVQGPGFRLCVAVAGT